MPSPFPGMDPWLEQHWGDVHTRLVTYCSDRLQAALPRNLRARVEERVYLEWEGEGEVAGRVKPFDEPTVERFIEIRDFSTGGRLVTVIEVLSPANKEPGRGRVSYLKKREELHEARVHLVEIDLLRTGELIDAIPRSELPEEYHTPYLVTVSREDPSGREYEIYKVPLERRLPVLPFRSVRPTRTCCSICSRS